MNDFYNKYSIEELNNIHYFLLKNKNYLCEKRFSSKFQKIYMDILYINFPDYINKFSQKLYHVFNNDVYKWELGKCKICGKRCSFRNFNIGYLTYCCNKCSGKDDEVKLKNKKTNIEKYGKNYAIIRSKKGIETFKKLGEDAKLNKIQKIKNTKFEKYGDENYNNNTKQKQTMFELYNGIGFSSNEIMKKYKNTMYIKYGDINYRNYTKREQTSIIKYDKAFYSITSKHKERVKDFWKYLSCEDKERMLEKSISTKKRNNSFNTSKIEHLLIDYFSNNNIKYIHQYKSILYPFMCDFYLAEYDLYIEIQGTWTHGKHPFNKDNKNDINLLNLWKSKNTKYYNNAIETWTIKDVKKRNIAKENNLNYLEIFSTNLKECINIINNYINNL